MPIFVYVLTTPSFMFIHLLILFQFFAIWDAAEMWLGVNVFWSFLLAIPLALIPIVGSGIGLVAAIDVWEWQWYWAVTVFGLPMAAWIYVIFSGDKSAQGGPKGRLP